MSAALNPLTVLLTEAAIRRNMATYASAVDRIDLDTVRACYAPDAVSDHGGYKGGVDGLLPTCFVGTR
jgi:hypothetical protein